MQEKEIKEWILRYQSKGLRLFTTCSFQSHSLVLLHLLTRIDKTIPVFFLNTGYHFPETITFKEEITKLFGITVTDLFSPVPKSMQKDSQGRLLFTSDVDFCCYLNKTLPMEPILHEYDIWINGVRADQSSVRKNFKVEEPAPHGCTRFHPMLDWTPKMINDYLKQYNIPRHPLESKGYLSIGCEPCTAKFDPTMSERDSRWMGLKKVECGLNTDLVNKK